MSRPDHNYASRSDVGKPEGGVRRRAPREEAGTDCFTPEKRSEVMSRVKSENTKPELSVRSALHRMGYRFRLHRKDLPGRPDIVLPKHRTAIFVHGCFWHQHPDCRKATVPVKNSAFWEAKLKRNKGRDEQAERSLRELGWNVVVVWECEVSRRVDVLEAKLGDLLRDATNGGYA